MRKCDMHKEKFENDWLQRPNVKTTNNLMNIYAFSIDFSIKKKSEC